jgi:hypothetical protein
MAQADQQVQNAAFPAFRTDVNDNLAALFSQSSGAIAPAVVVAYQPWIDTSSSPAVWKVRNGANTDWITIGTIDATTFALGGVTAVANGGTGSTTAAAALAALLPSQTGNASKGLTTDGTSASWTRLSEPTISTAVASTSGTAIDFTGIPSWVKRMTVMFNGVSTSGTSSLLIRLGTSAGIESTGYTATAYGQTNVVQTSVAGFILNCTTVTATDSRSGLLIISTLGSNAWVSSGNISPANGQLAACSGVKSLSGTLDRIRFTTNGTDTFDAGSINILYEG